MRKNPILISLTAIFIFFAMQQQALAQSSPEPSLQQRLGSLFSSPKEDELLDPEQAFKLKVTPKGPSTLVVELAPANGYYLYKDRTRFVLKNSSGAAIKSIKFPAGEIKNDRTFGRMEVYKKPVQIELSLDRPPSVKNISLVSSYQGCHEKTGVCYPPVESARNLNFP